MLALLGNYPNALNEMPQISKIGDATVQTYDYKSYPQRRAMVSVQPSAGQATNPLNSGTVEFRFEQQADRIAQGVYLRLAYVNNGGINAVVTCPEAIIDQVQIYSNNGSTLLYQTTNSVESYIINNVVLTRNEHENTINFRGTNNVYATGTNSYAPGVSGYWFLPICPTFWKALHLRPYSFYGNLIVRIRFAPASVTSVSGALTFTDTSLRVVQYYEPQMQKSIIERDAMLPKNFFYYAPQRHIQDVPFTGGQPQTIRLSGITGTVNILFFAIQLQTWVTDPTHQFDFQTAASYDILDTKNQSIIGHEQMVYEEGLVNYAHQVDNKFMFHKNFHMHSFSQSPVGDLARGTINGMEQFGGFHSLRITLPVGVNGTYTVFAIATCSETLKIVNGNVSSSRS